MVFGIVLRLFRKHAEHDRALKRDKRDAVQDMRREWESVSDATLNEE
jgi:hypothetical protein